MKIAPVQAGEGSCHSRTATGMNSFRDGSYWYEISYRCHVSKNRTTIGTGLNSNRYESSTDIMYKYTPKSAKVLHTYIVLRDS